ncbi:unnamed protein product [Linum tenue]|uniref:Uncharacterized protein n=1 Tax=Linum tenue TaxID=586396 RepID=A0AAV0HRL4_9ROSI|nr:unnamed protein product [Linum tenue]
MNSFNWFYADSEAAVEGLDGLFSTMTLEDTSVEEAEPGGPELTLMRSPFAHED